VRSRSARRRRARARSGREAHSLAKGEPWGSAASSPLGSEATGMATRLVSVARSRSARRTKARGRAR
jgi:hypothetical protein